VSEIVPLLIIIKLEQFDYAGATVLAVMMLLASFRPAARHQPAAALDKVAPWLNLAQAVRTQPAIKQPALKENAADAMAAHPGGARLPAAFLFLPLLAVFVEALRQGIGAYLAALVEPDALSAIKLTLLVAASVPLNWSSASPPPGASPSAVRASICC